MCTESLWITFNTDIKVFQSIIKLIHRKISHTTMFSDNRNYSCFCIRNWFNDSRINLNSTFKITLVMSLNSAQKQIINCSLNKRRNTIYRLFRNILFWSFIKQVISYRIERLSTLFKFLLKLFLIVADFLECNVRKRKRCINCGKLSSQWRIKWREFCFIYQLMFNFCPCILQNRTDLNFADKLPFQRHHTIKSFVFRRKTIFRDFYKNMNWFISEFTEVFFSSLNFNFLNLKKLFYLRNS